MSYELGSLHKVIKRDGRVVDFDAQRIVKMGKKPSQSTLLTQNAALNRVFDEAQMRGLITDATRPTLSVAGRKSVRRPPFSLEEVRAIDARFDDWIVYSQSCSCWSSG